MRAAVAVLCSVLAGAPVAAQRPPNVVVILADDLGYECLGCNGGTSYETPHLDALAASGARFTDCHAQPLCTPTRVQLLTGRYNVRNYVAFGRLLQTERTFGNAFRDAGYDTAIAGKWQLGRVASLPKHFGFDEHVLWQHTRFAPRYANPGLEWDSVRQDHRDGSYGPDLINAFVCEFVGRERDRPLLLYYPMILPHFPHQPTPDSADWDPARRGEQEGETQRHFADMVRYMDKLVGKLVAALDAAAVREQTLLLFVGDNGTNKQIRSQMGERTIPGGKHDPTVYGMHVPMIVSWPGRVAPRVCDDLVDTTDVLATICDAAGVPPPGDAMPEAAPRDGVSFWPQLEGEAGTPREWSYCWYSPRGEPLVEFAFDRRFKLHRDGRLFDYRADPLEQAPLAAAAEPDVREKLAAALARYEDARPAGMPWPTKD